MLAARVTLLDHHLVYVTGKGGVGKTTVAAALAVAAADVGRRVIVAEVHGQAQIPRLLGADAGAPGDEVEIADGLWHTTVAPWRVLEAWIGRILGSRALTSLLVRSNFFRVFAEAAPGGMELGTTVKLWELAQHERWDKKAQPYDLVVVDAPASGHGVGLLRTPQTFADLARVGPIATQSERVREFFGDSRQTGYLAVALPAELPVSETLETGRLLRRTLGRRLDAIAVNGVLADRFDAAELKRVRAAASDGVPRAIAQADGRADAQRHHVERLRADADAPVVELPFLFAPQLDAAHVDELADVLAAAIEK